MSELDTAMEAFSAALDKLEGALGGHEVRAEARSELENQIASLKEDRARLAEELDIAHADVRRLDGLNAQASAEIDATLKDIDRLLA
ncbi:MAG: DUF4164 domain-containing protein [Rhodobiaceae bacterium]|nr:hypothetical protein RHODOSMS8_02222 [Rhodobiaceae bacterium]MCR9241771.1 DUF4164 domain-containing protein [Rhodobiaceae bacterium]